jgi:transposase
MTCAILGVDIAKHKFDVCLLMPTNQRRQHVFANTPIGMERLAAWLIQHGVTQAHVCLEATGTYGETLARYLYDHDHLVSVINPAAITTFAASRLSRTKTDRVDAMLIAQFCRAQQPPLWTPLTPEVCELQALVRRLEGLTEMRGMEHNRFHAGSPSASVTASIAAHLAYIDAEIARVEHAIRDHIMAHASLHTQHTLLQSIPGIGAATAALFLAEVDVKQYTNARQVAAFAGLAPCIRQSGSSVRGRTRLSKVGSPRLRRALYFPAVTALRCSAGMRAWAAGLRERGKYSMQIIGAAMRKLVHIMYGVLKSGRPFDPALAHRP